jgi:hypothetical protein
VWGVVNVVCLVQAVGFATRPFVPQVNAILGVVIAAAALPATWALVVFARTRRRPLALAGPLAFDVFVCFMLVVDYVLVVEWRDPTRPAIQIPYLLLFFGSIVLMGLPMYWLDRGLWRVTAASAGVLLATMAFAMYRGVA